MLAVWPGQTARGRERGCPLDGEAEDRRRRGMADGWSREEGCDDGIRTASGSLTETPFDHPKKVLRSGPERGALESARCLISGHANEIRCASKRELAGTDQAL